MRDIDIDGNKSPNGSTQPASRGTFNGVSVFDVTIALVYISPTRTDVALTAGLWASTFWRVIGCLTHPKLSRKFWKRREIRSSPKDFRRLTLLRARPFMS